jgi:hypothetical protein
MGNRLPRGLGGRGHWLDMLGVGEEKVNVQGLNRIVGVTCMVRRRTARRIELDENSLRKCIRPLGGE